MIGRKATKTGWFTPIFPEKYKGDPTKIRYRSSWEWRVFQQCDTSHSIIAWASEEIQIPYLDPTTYDPATGAPKLRMYIPDIWLQVKLANDSIKTMMFEIKPYKETIAPVNKRGKRKDRVLSESMTYIKNLAKWEAAQKLCNKYDWEFKVISEHQIFG